MRTVIRQQQEGATLSRASFSGGNCMKFNTGSRRIPYVVYAENKGKKDATRPPEGEHATFSYLRN